MKAHENWKALIGQEIHKDYYKKLTMFLKNELSQGREIFPPKENWFNALCLSPQDTKVIIVGQDPYHGAGQAHGFSFSVTRNTSLPPSLRNIYEEIKQEFSIEMSQKNGDLTPWVKQGVLLLNTVLTVEKNKPGSHRNIGWEVFTDAIISAISMNFSHKVFMLWGKNAMEKKILIDDSKHLILTSAHPSPYSADRGFFGNKHFIKANNYLSAHGIEAINWQVKDE